MSSRSVDVATEHEGERRRNVIFAVGHNIASQQTVLWMRILDRLYGLNRPRLIVVDLRETATAKEADVHLQLRVGTNVALPNGLLHLIIAQGHLDCEFIQAHTTGIERLEARVAAWTPERVTQVMGVPEKQLHEAAETLDHRKISVMLGIYSRVLPTLQTNAIQPLSAYDSPG